MMFNINDVKNGMTVIIDGKLCLIQEFQKTSPGKGSAFVKMRLKNLRTGTITVDNYPSNIKLEKAHIDKVKAKYMYPEGNKYVFMDSTTFEMNDIDKEVLGDSVKYLKDELEIQFNSYEGEIIGIELPEKIDYTVKSTEPATKGNTTSSAMKDAVLENDTVVKVPLFINEGEVITVSTEDGSYCGRA